MANVRDFDKGQNIGYKLKMNAHRRIEAFIKKQAATNPATKAQIEEEINNSKDDNGNPTKTEQQVIDEAIDRAYRIWLRKSYNAELERYEQNKLRLANKKPRLENFD
jgi:hypothetical protein